MTKKGKGKKHKRRRPGTPASATPSAQGKRFGEKRSGASSPGPGQEPRKPRAAATGPRRFAFTQKQPREAPGEGPAAAPRGAIVAAAKAATSQRLAAWQAQGEALKQQRAQAHADEQRQLDPWQQQVLAALERGDSVVVDAPTTAGKTRAVEVFFHRQLANPRFRAAYTTPVKSLSNDKLREFRQMFGSEHVGIATGDIKENLDAPIVVATLESYRNSLLGVEPDLGRQVVVFDEYHYLQDDSRGSAWEEALILTPPSCQVLLLSASVANAEKFSEWLSSLEGGRVCHLVRTETRPVPLVQLVHYGGEWLLPETLPEAVLTQLDRTRLSLPLRQEELADKVVGLMPLGLTPAILYCGRRLAAETMAALLCRQLPPLDTPSAEKIGASLQLAHAEFSALSFIQPKLRQMLQVYGVGFHHSGLAAPARMAIEAFGQARPPALLLRDHGAKSWHQLLGALGFDLRIPAPRRRRFHRLPALRGAADARPGGPAR